MCRFWIKLQIYSAALFPAMFQQVDNKLPGWKVENNVGIFFSKGLSLMDLTGCCWGYWVHRDGSYSSCLACPSLQFLLLPLSLHPPPPAFNGLSDAGSLASRRFCPGLFLDVMLRMREIRLKTEGERKKEIFPGGLRFKEIYIVSFRKTTLSKKIKTGSLSPRHKHAR